MVVPPCRSLTPSVRMSCCWISACRIQMGMRSRALYGKSRGPRGHVPHCTDGKRTPGEIERQAVEAGFDFHLRKPYELKDLQAVIVAHRSRQ